MAKKGGYAVRQAKRNRRGNMKTTFARLDQQAINTKNATSLDDTAEYSDEAPCIELSSSDQSSLEIVKSETSPSKLLNLPLDIVIDILEYMLIHEGGFLVDAWKNSPRIHVRRALEKSLFFRPRILETCKALNEIGTPMLYGKNVFNIPRSALINCVRMECIDNPWRHHCWGLNSSLNVVEKWLLSAQDDPEDRPRKCDMIEHINITDDISKFVEQSHGPLDHYETRAEVLTTTRKFVGVVSFLHALQRACSSLKTLQVTFMEPCAELDNDYASKLLEYDIYSSSDDLHESSLFEKLEMVEEQMIELDWRDEYCRADSSPFPKVHQQPLVVDELVINRAVTGWQVKGIPASRELMDRWIQSLNIEANSLTFSKAENLAFANGHR